MKGRGVYVFVTLIIILLSLIIYLLVSGNSKIGVINSQKVLEEYEGFKEARDIYEVKVKELSQNFEKQRSLYESKSNELEIIFEKLSQKEKIIKQEELENYKKELLKLGALIEQKSEEEEDKLLQGVYNKVDDFIERYGKEKNFDVILGTTSEGNILYRDETIDITDEIIIELNKEHLDGVEK